MDYTPLPRSFYQRDALVVAKALIGTYLVVGEQVVRIVETEAYRGPKDRACHARAGLTKRTRTLFGPPGHAYVFLVYGMYDCFNVVCLGEGEGHAVLVRAVEPIENVDAKTTGPGLLTRALAITRADDGVDLVSGERMFVAKRTGRPTIDITARVGIGYAGKWADMPWRFVDAKSAFSSKPPKRSIGRPRPAARSTPSRP